MAFVYILVSEKNGSYYVGSTVDMERRLTEHNSGHTASLLNIRPLRVVFYQEYANIVEARRIEKKLKRFKSRKIIDQIISDGKIKLGP